MAKFQCVDMWKRWWINADYGGQRPNKSYIRAS
jgi:hypothetical protein